jgi:hypothetical protein
MAWSITSLRMLGKFEAAKYSFHLFIAPVHPDRKLGNLQLRMGHAHIEIADTASNLAEIALQVGDIRLNSPKHFEYELIRYV